MAIELLSKQREKSTRTEQRGKIGATVREGLMNSDDWGFGSSRAGGES